MTHRLAQHCTGAFAGAALAIPGAHAQPVSGPYVSLGAGGNYLQDERLTKDPIITGKLRFNIGETGVAAIGESNPLVQTAMGVREPQNRRVEIILK